MNWSNAWGTPAPPAQPEDPRDKLSNDEVLLRWRSAQEALQTAKNVEMEWRQYAVKRSFPNAHEGTNKIELGQGYELKAKIKYNYSLHDNDTVWAGLDELSKTGNDGTFIAERIVSWSPNFLLTEYRKIEEEAEEGNPLAKQRLSIISKFMTKKEAAPELEIKEPRRKS